MFSFGLTEFTVGFSITVFDQGAVFFFPLLCLCTTSISRDEIAVHYNHGHCQIDPILALNTNTTLKDIWKKSIEQPGVLVLIKHQKTHVFELECYVDYPPRPSTQSDYDLVSDFGQVTILLIITNSWVHLSSTRIRT